MSQTHEIDPIKIPFLTVFLTAASFPGSFLIEILDESSKILFKAYFMNEINELKMAINSLKQQVNCGDKLVLKK